MEVFWEKYSPDITNRVHYNSGEWKNMKKDHDLLLSRHYRCAVVLGNFGVGSFTAVVWHLIVMFARYCGTKVISLTASHGEFHSSLLKL